jgi:hypothetical protein
MPNNDFTDEIVIRFDLTKGSGDYPTNDELTQEEKHSIQIICNFHLDLDYWKFDEEPDSVPIKEVTILYDGIKKYKNNKSFDYEKTYGLYWDESQSDFLGHPSPVVLFKFSQLVHKESFLKLIEQSSVNLCSKAQVKNDCEGYFFQDYRGYPQIIPTSKVKSYINFLIQNQVYLGRVFSYEDGDQIFPLTEK